MVVLVGHTMNAVCQSMVDVNVECNFLVESMRGERGSCPFCCVGVAACAQILGSLVHRGRQVHWPKEQVGELSP